MLKHLKNLCELDAPSGAEASVNRYIIENLPENASYRIDAMGNLIVEKKGKKTPKNKVMLDAHSDEVGFMISGITENGFLRFITIGGIEATSIIARRVRFLNGAYGVVVSKPIHNMTDSEKNSKPNAEELFIDIGANTKQDAEAIVKIGDSAVFDTPYCELGEDKLLSKALDDRIGCAIILDLLNNFDEYDFTASFSVQEEVGLRGAKVSAFSIDPDYAIVIEATTAADIDGVAPDKAVCRLNDGAVVSFMDGTTLYNHELYKGALALSLEKGIKAQPKAATSGGNDAGSIHSSRAGVKTIAISAPCRYIHSSSCLSSKEDILALRSLAEALLVDYCERL